MKYLCILAFLINPLFMVAQEGKARKILDKLGEKFDAYETMELTIDLVIHYPENEPEEKEVILIQDGNSFLFDTDDQQMIGDGKSVWYILKDRNEVQISDFEGEDDLGVPTPGFILKEYKAGLYETRLIGEKSSIAEIELKPLDDSDYSKIKVSINRKLNELTYVSAYSKDGSRIDVTINSLTTNKSYGPETFNFDASDFPGIFIEDLRID